MVLGYTACHFNSNLGFWLFSQPTIPVLHEVYAGCNIPGNPCSRDTKRSFARAARGCKVVLIDALPEPVKQTKASGVVARSLEVLPSDVESKMLQNGNMLKAMQILEKKEH
eukprot:s4749_g6.t1